MSTMLRQSTAVDIGLGPFVDQSDGFTPETTLTISQADVRLKKNGGSWAQKNQSSSASHEENGWYEVSLDTTDTNTLGELIVAVNESGALPVWRVFQIVPSMVYDSLIAGSDTLQADVTQYGGSAGTFSGGRPEVNTTHLAGTAYATQRDALVDLVWDEVLTAATHNVATSAGRRLRELASGVVTSGTAQAGTINTITLANTASSVDGTYDPSIVWIVSGTGAGQARLILQYFGASRLAYVDRDWRTAPDATSEYQIIASTNPMSTNEGVAAGATANTITLNTLASSVNDIYTGQQVVVRTGTGQDQSRLITAYNGATRIATVAQPWTVTPTSSSAYIMFPTGRAMVTQIGDDVITAAALSTGAANEIADALLKRDWTSVSGEAARSALNALRFLRNKWSISGATLTVTTENDTTTAWQATLTSDAAADPVTGSDPS